MKRRTLVFTLLMALFLSPTLLEAQQNNKSGVIVPAYFFPYDDAIPGKHNVGPYWSALIDAAAKYGDKLVVVANPNNGPGSNAGWEKQKYKEAIDKVRAAGGKVIGYVHTCWGLTNKEGNCSGRTEGDIRQDIADWKAWYGVDGIFLDEAPTNMPNWIKAVDELAGKTFGWDYNVNNFGTIPSHESIWNHGVPRPEIQIIMEQTVAYYNVNQANLPTVGYNAGVILYAGKQSDIAPIKSAVNAKKINWFYLTNDSGANPYDTLPSFFEDNF